MVFPKKITLEYDLSFIIWKDSIFFPGKYDIFPLDGKRKMIFLKKYMEIWYFQYICINITNMILPFCKQKKSKMTFSRKNTLKGDLYSRSHSRKSSKDSLYFYWDLLRRFHILLSSEKNPGNIIHKTKIWLLLQCIWLVICNTLYLQPSGVVFRGVLEHQLRKLFVH